MGRAMGQSKPFFINIVSVSEYFDYTQMPEAKRSVFDEFMKSVGDSFDYKKAGIIPEFGKVIVISYAFDGDDVIKSLAGHNEPDILVGFSDVLNNCRDVIFVGHNIKSFDIPFLLKRYIINSIEPPDALKMCSYYKKNHPVIDVSDMWKFCGRTYVPLDNIAVSLGFDSYKKIMRGSDVFDTYYLSNDLEKIVAYSEEKLYSSILSYYRINDLML